MTLTEDALGSPFRVGYGAAELPLAHESPEQAAVRRAVAAGTVDENSLTDLVFFARHPQRGRRPLSSGEPGFAALAAEWVAIRDTVVRPLLRAVPRPTTPSPSPSPSGLWVPGAERVSGARSGGSYVGGPWRFVFHTIEGEPSAAGFRTLAAGHQNPPHLWAMPSTDLLLQTIPLDRSAYALAHPDGSAETNRQHAIQCELHGFAAKMGDASAETLAWLAERVLAPVARLVPIDLTAVRLGGLGERCYGTGSPCRMSVDDWLSFNGVTGHNCVPGNEHWDPGDLDVARIAARARDVVAGGGTPVRREAGEYGLSALSDHDGPGFLSEREEAAGPSPCGCGGAPAEAPWAGAAAPVTRTAAGTPAGLAAGTQAGPWAHTTAAGAAYGASRAGEPRPDGVPRTEAPWTEAPWAGTGWTEAGWTEAGWTEAAARTGAPPWAAELEELAADEVRWIQSSLNRIIGAKLAVDGIFGPLTRAAVMDFQRRQGLVVDGIVGPVTRAALQRAGAGAPPAAGYPPPVPAQPGAMPATVGVFDGQPVARWMIPYLEWARQQGWQGVLISGYRTPEESEKICFGKCQAPSCPGTCAGRASNHSGDTSPRGAVDVSDQVRFGELMARYPLEPKLKNDLPSDQNHFSVTGH